MRRTQQMPSNYFRLTATTRRDYTRPAAGLPTSSRRRSAHWSFWSFNRYRLAVRPSVRPSVRSSVRLSVRRSLQNDSRPSRQPFLRHSFGTLILNSPSSDDRLVGSYTIVWHPGWYCVTRGRTPRVVQAIKSANKIMSSVMQKSADFVCHQNRPILLSK